MPKTSMGEKGLDFFAKKLVILGIFILVMVILVPFFYGWINGKAHEKLCEAVGIKSVWSCGLIIRDPSILQGYLQLSGPQVPPSGSSQEPSKTLPPQAR
ncbi:MAG: hypothetical protein HY001_04390 [Candidatus Portnoybacteria bacterium]|nr:hypothetical protein [Candidatus Portnoybacteria bacterium]